MLSVMECCTPGYCQYPVLSSEHSNAALQAIA